MATAITYKLSGSHDTTDGSGQIINKAFAITDATQQAFTPIVEYTLAPSAVDTVVDFCQVVTGKFVLLESDGKDFDVKFNAATENVTFNPLAIVSGDFTAIKLSNPSSSVSVTISVQVTGKVS